MQVSLVSFGRGREMGLHQQVSELATAQKKNRNRALAGLPTKVNRHEPKN